MRIPPVIPEIKVCLTCRHLRLVGEGREIEDLQETGYQDYACARFGSQVREYPYFPTGEPGQLTIEEREGETCPGWEAWRPESQLEE